MCAIDDDARSREAPFASRDRADVPEVDGIAQPAPRRSHGETRREGRDEN